MVLVVVGRKYWRSDKFKKIGRYIDHYLFNISSILLSLWEENVFDTFGGLF